MLVLSRKPNQKILINGTIEIRVLQTRGNSVKLGFVCPPEVTVHREEVAQRIRERGGRTPCTGTIHPDRRIAG